MTRPGVRFVLILILLAGVAGAGYVGWSREQAAQSEIEQARDFDARAARALAAIADMRLGHQAYVASGQSVQWWQQHVATDLEEVKAALAELRQRVDDPGVLNDLDAAAVSLDEFAQADRRAANLVRNGETSQASRLVFGDGDRALVATAERVASARLVVLQDIDTRRAAHRSLEVQLAAGCAGLAVVVALLLVPVGKRASQEPVEPPMLTVAPPASSGASTGPAPGPAEDPAVTTPGAPPSAQEPAPESAITRDRRKAPELRATADLCTDFARLRDPQELPALLDRSARLLDAVGLIVWVADPLGNDLRPTFAHGYPAQVVARLPAIARSADNATAAAYRNAQVEVVKTNGMSPGAIVVPLLTPDGCIGVVAAEVRHGREASETSRAVARILAAQLATLLSVPEAQDHSQHAAR